jgi:hypothetical protein
MISSASPITSASAVNVDAILAILDFQLIPSLISIDWNPRNGFFSIFEPSVAKILLVFIISWIFLKFLVVIPCFIYLSSLVEIYPSLIEEAFLCLPEGKGKIP